jgi:sugar/nucleoside kinase (ribokinase family)
LAELGAADPQRFVLADSREQIQKFRNVCLKPNLRECLGAPADTLRLVQKGQTAVAELAKELGRPVFCTCGEHGIIVGEPGASPVHVPAYAVSGPIDPVGAGDSVSAGIASVRAAGASLVEAAQFGNLIASITIQQLGTTGSASPAQVRARWREVSTREPSP